ncbi:MAG: hypothetical protein ACOCXY_02240 [Planctomycetota bacterium]
MKSRETMTVLMAIVALAGPALAGNKGDVNPFKKHAKPIGQLLKLKWEGKSLQVDREHWGREGDVKTKEHRKAELIKKFTARGMPEKFAKRQAEMLVDRAPLEDAFAELRKSAGSFRSAMSNTNGMLYKSFRGKDLGGDITQSDTALTIEVMEMVGDTRRLRVSDSPSGLFLLNLIQPAGKTVLILNQDEDGKVRLVHIDGDDVHNYKADSFLELYREHTAYVNETLFPAIRSVGVTLPLGPYDDRIVSAVFSRLKGELTDAERKRVNGILDDLEASDYPTRQAATEKLKKNYFRWRPVIQKAMKERKFSREAKSRLEGVIAANATADQYGQIIDGLGLLKSPVYLVELVDRSKGEDRKAAIKHLRKVTGQDIGDDVKAWRAWLAERKQK